MNPDALVTFPAEDVSINVVKFEYWKSSIDRRWYWHLKTVGNEKLAQGEPYASKTACVHAIEQVQKSAHAAVHNLSPRER